MAESSVRYAKTLPALAKGEYCAIIMQYLDIKINIFYSYSERKKR